MGRKKKERKTRKTYFQNHENPLVYFGAGPVGRIQYEQLKSVGIYPDYFCDNDPNKWGKPIYMGETDVPCISPEELYRWEKVDVFITLTKADEVYEQLKDKVKGKLLKYPILYLDQAYDIFCYEKDQMIEIMKQLFCMLDDSKSKAIAYSKWFSFFASFEENNRLEFSSVYTSDWYMPQILKNMDDLYMVDCGAYTGDTLEEFVGGGVKFKEYYAYEMNPQNFQKLKENICTYESSLQKKIHAYPVGVGKEAMKATYLSMGIGSTLNAMGDACADVVCLDEHLKGKEISYIKMDIEGAEQDAILGAKEHIKKYSPKCAISCYHKAADLWEIPFLLKQMVPAYKLYLRHHALTYCETVCYAIAEERD